MSTCTCASQNPFQEKPQTPDDPVTGPTPKKCDFCQAAFAEKPQTPNDPVCTGDEPVGIGTGTSSSEVPADIPVTVVNKYPVVVCKCQVTPCICRQRDDSMYQDLYVLLNGRDISDNNIIQTVVQLMQNAEKFTELEGLEKKELIIRVYDKYLHEHPCSVGVDMLPTIMDSLIAVDRREVTVKERPRGVFGCCRAK